MQWGWEERLVRENEKKLANEITGKIIQWVYIYFEHSFFGVVLSPKTIEYPHREHLIGKQQRLYKRTKTQPFLPPDATLLLSS